MATVTTTSVTNPLIYPGNTLIDYSTYDGYWYVMVRASTANTFEVWRTNTGVSWALYASLVRANVAEIGSIFTSPMGWISWCYRTNESSEDKVFYRRLSLAAGTWSSEILMTATSPNGGVAGTVWGGMDVATVDYGPSNAYQAGIVVIAQASNGGCWLTGFNTLPGGQPQANNNVMAGNRQMLPFTTTTGHHTPSIDIEHAGNGKTASVPNLWVTYGRNGIFMNKIAWNGHGWIVPTGKVDITGIITARDYIPGRWDGSRFLMVRTNASTVILYERNQANTSTTTRTTPTHPAGVTRSTSVSYNSTNGNPRVFAVGTSDNDLHYVDYDRLAGTWGGWTTVTATDITGANVDNFSPRRGTYGNAKFDVLTAHTGVNIVHNSLSVAFAPLVPTWVFTSVPYMDGSAADVNASLLLDWQFNDPDPADTQSAYAVRRQIGAGAFAYWRASDSTWQVAEVQNTSSTTQLTLASGWGAGTDANHSYAVKVWDSTAVASPYSAALVLVPSVKVNPTISIPVDSSTWSTDTLTTTWTVSEQTAFQAQITFLGVVLEDSGKQVSSATTWTFATTLLAGWNYTVRLWTWNAEGLQSTMDENPFSVQFLPPQTPTLVATPDPTNGYITVTVTNPGPAAFVAAGTAANADNATLNPALPAGLAAADLLLDLATIRNSGTGFAEAPAGWSTLVAFGNLALFGKSAAVSESAPSQPFVAGAAGATTSAQLAALRRAGPGNVIDSVNDVFGRTVSNGWGSADSGQAWAITLTASQYAVSGGTGRITPDTLSSNRFTLLDTGAGADRLARSDVMYPALPASGILMIGLSPRAVGLTDHYLAELRISTVGAVTLRMSKRVANVSTTLVDFSHPTAYVAGTWWRIKTQAIGTALRAKAWPAASDEPASWQIDTTDSALPGGSLVMCYARNETAVTTHTAQFDQVAVPNVPAAVTQLNGSAQNISYPGLTPGSDNCVVLLAVWKQAVNTAVSTPAGFTLIGNNSSALGSGQSTTWYYQIQTAATAVPSGTVTVTGGVSAISRAVIVSLPGPPLVLYNDIWRIRNGSFGDQIRVIQSVPTNGSGNDWRAVSKQEYLYQAIAIGDNGTSAPGLFTP